MQSPHSPGGSKFRAINDPSSSGTSETEKRSTRSTASASAKQITDQWDILGAGLPPQRTRLTGLQILEVIQSDLPTVQRSVHYPYDFGQKGIPRMTRTHLDPPAVVKNMSGQDCYAVVCGSYELHGETGQREGLSDRKGDGKGSVKTDVLSGTTLSGRPAENSRPVPITKSDVSEISEGTTSDEPETAGIEDPRVDQLVQFGKIIDATCVGALQMTKSLLSDGSKTAADKETKREFNRLVQARKSARREIPSELLDRIDDIEQE